MKTILIVDDEPSARTLLREILEPEGYAVLEAADGLEALRVLDDHPADLIITDRAMPGLGGLELLKVLRAKKRRLPALVISAYGEERLWAQAIGLGADDYLVKPFKNQDVLNGVRRALSQGPAA